MTEQDKLAYYMELVERHGAERVVKQLLAVIWEIRLKEAKGEFTLIASPAALASSART